MSLFSRLRESLDRTHGRPVTVAEPEGFSVRRKLPGIASRTVKDDAVDFRSGTVILAEDWRQYMEIEHPEHKHIWAIGDNYMYWCDVCKVTVWEQEISKLNPIVLGGPNGTSVIKCCPFCATWGVDGRITDGTELSAVRVGTKVRAHYRYMPDGSSGNWWAEVLGGR